MPEHISFTTAVHVLTGLFALPITSYNLWFVFYALMPTNPCQITKPNVLQQTDAERRQGQALVASQILQPQQVPTPLS